MENKNKCSLPPLLPLQNYFDLMPSPYCEKKARPCEGSKLAYDILTYMFLRFAYTIFIGILFAAFVGVGIDAFYKTPQPPQYPIELRKPYPVNEEDLTQEEKLQLDQKQLEVEIGQKDFETQKKEHNKTISIIALASSVVIVALSLTLLRQAIWVADGLSLGGVITLVYSIIRGFDAGDSLFRFIVGSAGLFLSLLLGYIKFAPIFKKSS